MRIKAYASLPVAAVAPVYSTSPGAEPVLYSNETLKLVSLNLCERCMGKKKHTTFNICFYLPLLSFVDKSTLTKKKLLVRKN